jgi:hypothetical protein
MSEVTLAQLGFEGGQRVADTGTLARMADTGAKSSTGITTSVEDRALQLLGAGIAAEAAANALGVTPGRIAQLLSEEAFSDKVSTLRYENLQKHNVRDSNYDTIEDQLLGKLESALPFMIKPHEILKGIAVINNAKRRGQSAPEQVVNQQNIVNLILPAVITQKFAVNIDNQVIRAGQQELHTMPASNLLQEIEATVDRRQEALSHLEAPLTEEGTCIEAL